MDDGVISLTEGFAAADEATWRALVEKTLNGASFEKRLVSRTYDGIAVQPLYTAANTGSSLDEALRGRDAFDADRPWDIRALVDHPDPKTANALTMEDLEGGATSLLVKIDPSGETGVAVASRGDLEHVLEGVLLDLAPVALDAGYLGPEAARWLNDIAQSKTLRPHLHLQLDPISVFAETGVSPGPIAAHIDAAARAAADIDAETAFLASGRVAHEAGGTDAQEIAMMAAAGLAYIKAANEAGADIDAAIRGVALGLAASADYFAGIAKFRAARAVWARVCGAISNTARPTRIEARSSRRMLSTLDPWVNMLRLTSAAFSASIGGADTVLLDPFTQPLGRPTPFARRQTRNVQLVLMEEAHLGRVVDPAGGAWFVETMTDQTAKAAWAFFQKIEADGGVVAALTSGLIAAAVADAREARSADVAKRRAGLVGVSEFPNLSEAAVEVDTVDPAPFAKPSPSFAQPGVDGACPPMEPWRMSMGFERLRKRAEAMGAPPSAYLATLGAPKDYTARVGFARNALAAGGVATEVGDASDYDASQNSLAVICGSDPSYAEIGADIAQALKVKGAGMVYLAGRADTLEADLKAAGVDGFIFAGADIEAILDDVLNGWIRGAEA
jgi:methylmalonyl-CoA mutase